MKRILILTILIGLTVTLYARNIRWRATDKPPVSIIKAVEQATKELNKDGADFYCLGASVARNFSECDWELQFSNAAGQSRAVSVGSDGKIRISEHGFLVD